jgi:hypothetical protein
MSLTASILIVIAVLQLLLLSLGPYTCVQRVVSSYASHPLDVRVCEGNLPPSMLLTHSCLLIPATQVFESVGIVMYAFVLFRAVVPQVRTHKALTHHEIKDTTFTHLGLCKCHFGNILPCISSARSAV